MNFRKRNFVAIATIALATLLSGQSVNAQSAETTNQTSPAEVKVTLKQGDTLSSVADAHQTTYVRIFNANENITNPDVINAGEEIRIPTADEELTDRYATFLANQAVATAAVNTTAVSYASTANSYNAPAQATTTPQVRNYGVTAGNTYYWGQCTWYVKNRRPDMPNALGNGGQWTSSARARGMATGSTPVAGAVAEMPGHVMYVESVNGNGTINVSEMNWNGGVGQVNYRTTSASGLTYIY